MALYSKFNWSTSSFDHYQDGLPQGLDVDPKIAPSLQHPIGVPVERILGGLPGGARKIGSGPAPVGQMVASGGGGIGDWPQTALTFIGIAILSTVVISFLRR